MRKRWRDEEHESIAVELVSVFSNNSAVRKRQRIGTRLSDACGGHQTPSCSNTDTSTRHLPPPSRRRQRVNDAFSPSPYVPSRCRSSHSFAFSFGNCSSSWKRCRPAASFHTPHPHPRRRHISSHLRWPVRVNSSIHKPFDVDSFIDSAGGSLLRRFRQLRFMQRKHAMRLPRARHSTVQHAPFACSNGRLAAFSEGRIGGAEAVDYQYTSCDRGRLHQLDDVKSQICSSVPQLPFSKSSHIVVYP